MIGPLIDGSFAIEKLGLIREIARNLVDDTPAEPPPAAPPEAQTPVVRLPEDELPPAPGEMLLSDRIESAVPQLRGADIPLGLRLPATSATVEAEFDTVVLEMLQLLTAGPEAEQAQPAGAPMRQAGAAEPRPASPVAAKTAVPDHSSSTASVTEAALAPADTAVPSGHPTATAAPGSQPVRPTVTIAEANQEAATEANWQASDGAGRQSIEGPDWPATAQTGSQLASSEPHDERPALILLRADSASGKAGDPADPARPQRPAPEAPATAATGARAADDRNDAPLERALRALGANAGAGAAAAAPQGGIIPSFILNAHFQPGWPPARPIQDPEAKALVAQAAVAAGLGKDDIALLTYLVNFGLNRQQISRILKLLAAATNQPGLLVALGAFFANIGVLLGTLKEELDVLAEEIEGDRADRAKRSRLELR